LKRKLVIAGLVIIGVFGITNIIWFSTVKAQYSRYENLVPLNKEFNVRLVQNTEKNLIYGYDTPGYLRLTGNLFYTQKFPEEQIAYTFIIWPKPFNKEEYGVIVQEKGESYQIEITPTLDVRGKDLNDLYSKELLDEHRERLEPVLEDARKAFEIKGY
jgi:hypothetical protein